MSPDTMWSVTFLGGFGCGISAKSNRDVIPVMVVEMKRNKGEDSTTNSPNLRAELFGSV